MGAIELDKADIRAESYSLPEQFVWDNVNLLDELQVKMLLDATVQLL